MCISLNGLGPVCQCIRIDLLCFRHRRAAQCEIDDLCCKMENKIKKNNHLLNNGKRQEIQRVRVRIYERLTRHDCVVFHSNENNKKKTKTKEKTCSPNTV